MRKTLLIAVMTGGLALGAVSTYAGGYSGSVTQVDGKHLANACNINNKKQNTLGEEIQKQNKKIVLPEGRSGERENSKDTPVRVSGPQQDKP